MGDRERLRLLLVDDQDLVRSGLRMILESQPDIEVVEAADGSSGLVAAAEMRPDVVLMDLRMPGMDGMDGIEATRRLTSMADPPMVVVLTTFDFPPARLRRDQGRRHRLLDQERRPGRPGRRGVRAAARGDALLAPSTTRRLLEHFVQQPRPGTGLPSALAELTEREVGVLRLVATGRSNADIAAELFLGEATVKTHSTGC